MSASPPPPPPLPPLPDVPGGWTLQRYGAWELHQPAVPDRFLDDPDVLAANQRDDYMPYWSSMWPAAPLMAEAIVAAPWPRGSRVLEIGAGIGLVGLACLARGDQVTFSDYEPLSALLCRWNAVHNGFADPLTEVLDWRVPTGPQFPVIVGCEVTYEVKNHPLLLALFAERLAADGVVWLGDPGRYHARGFVKRAQAAGWSVQVREEEGRNCPLTEAGTFRIFELRREFS